MKRMLETRRGRGRECHYGVKVRGKVLTLINDDDDDDDDNVHSNLKIMKAVT